MAGSAICSHHRCRSADKRVSRVEVWSADKIDVEEGKLGLAGSPTKVFKSFPTAMKAPGEIHEVTPEEAVELIVNQLKVKHII